MEYIRERLTDKNDKAACDFARQMAAESAESDKYLESIPLFASLLQDRSSYVRTRAFGLICSQARWAHVGQIDVSKYKDSMSPLITKDIEALKKEL